MEEDNPASEQSQESAEPVSLEIDPNYKIVLFGIAVGIWVFPLLVSWSLFLFSLGNAELLGFWIVSRIGPFDLLTSSISQNWLLVLALIIDIAIAVAMFKFFRSKHFQYSIFVLLGILAWYIWGLIIFINSIRIA